MSTNKVYGDAPNELPLVELPTRWDYANPADYQGIKETMRIDQSKHSLFGASKTAADIMVQEYGRYFGMPTACFRGGCLTGPNHSGVELHGFLSFLVKTALKGKTFTIFGYRGKAGPRPDLTASTWCALSSHSSARHEQGRSITWVAAVRATHRFSNASR